MSFPNSLDEKYKNFGINVGQRLLLTTVLSPLEYSKILIQIGFEPIPPKETTTLLGKPALGLPNVFQYIKYIYGVDGLSGCFRGLSARLYVTFLSTVTYSAIVDKFPVQEIEQEARRRREQNREAGRGAGQESTVAGIAEPTDIEKEQIFLKTLARDIVAHSAAITVSHPFYVVAVRSMAQFVGRETKYNGVWNAITTICSEEGISGLFSGIVPRLIGEISTITLFSSITYCVNTYLIKDEEHMQQMMGIAIDFLVKNLTYPFHVVTVCLAVNNSGLKAGSPPLMPSYSGSWRNCWSDLNQINQLKRGSGLIWRYYVPPKSTAIIPPALPSIQDPEKTK